MKLLNIFFKKSRDQPMEPLHHGGICAGNVTTYFNHLSGLRQKLSVAAALLLPPSRRRVGGRA